MLGTYDPHTDAAYIYLAKNKKIKVEKTRELVKEKVYIDFNRKF